jgi:pimeloyl-ACP methyl ester carboxylesterase
MPPLRLHLRLLLASFILVNLACSSISPPTPETGRQVRVDLSPCRFANHKSELLCAKYSVFEDRTMKSGRVIALNIVVVPAETKQPAKDPVFFLTGGPGQGAARIAARGEEALMRELRRERDLIYIDLRGTGNSNGLRCDVGADRSSLQNYFP